MLPVALMAFPFPCTVEMHTRAGATEINITEEIWAGLVVGSGDKILFA